MAEKEIVFKRDEFTAYLAERLDDPTDIARYFQFIESAFVLQNDAHRPAYIFETDEKISQEQLDKIADIMYRMGCIACIVPSKTLKYAGTVTPTSIGMEGIRNDA